LSGVASGMALRGLRPAAEIMFGDFVTLIADQVINHAAKFRWMYNDGRARADCHPHADGWATRLRADAFAVARKNSSSAFPA